MRDNYKLLTYLPRFKCICALLGQALKHFDVALKHGASCKSVDWMEEASLAMADVLESAIDSHNSKTYRLC